MQKDVWDLRSCWGLLIWALVAAPVQSEGAALLVPPQIREVSVPEVSKPGKPLEIVAHVSDDDGIREVILYYRDFGTNVFTPLAMTPQLPSHDIYTATIPGKAVRSPGIEYYVYARDQKEQAVPAFQSRETPDADPIDQRALEQLLYKVQVKASDKNTWTWVALGALAAGVVVALQGDGGSGDSANQSSPAQSSPGNPTTSIDIKGPLP